MAKDKDPFDDLFEPFELEDGPPPPGTEAPAPPRPEPKQPQASAPVEQAPCPSCGAFNPAYNRHCEQCGARLTQEPLPVAPAPMVRATPGGRALSVLAAAVLVVALVALLVNVFGGGGDDDTAPETTTSTTTSTIQNVIEIKPTDVRASAQLGAAYDDSQLIDDNFTTEWQANHADDLEIVFTFAQPVQIEYLQIFNIDEQDRFLRNYRIEGYKITVDDLAIDFRSTLKDEAGGPQQIDIASVGTQTLTLEILSSFASQGVSGEPPFEELVVAEIKFWGRSAG